MKIWIAEILVRTGVAVLADGRCRPRWHDGDQERQCKHLQRAMWFQSRGVIGGATYYEIRRRITGGNWQGQLYRKGLKRCEGALYEA